jgi:hypothetical protein
VRSSLVLYIWSCTYITGIKVEELFRDLQQECAEFERNQLGRTDRTDAAPSRDRHTDKYGGAMSTPALDIKSNGYVELAGGSSINNGSIDNDNNTDNERSEGCEYTLLTVIALLCCQ